MKILQLLILLLLVSPCFSQKVTKSEFKQIIKESKKEEKKSGFLHYSTIITDNQDSLYFKSERVKIYSSRAVLSKNNVCRTIELKFVRNKKVHLNDCQTCSEPAFCYVATDKSVYRYKLRKKEDGLYIFFKNVYNEMNFKVISMLKKELDSREYFEIILDRKKTSS